MPGLSRRGFLCRSAVLGLLACRPHTLLGAESAAAVTFSFGTYGTKSLATEDALRLIASIGYDGVELAVRPEWSAAPENMPPERRRSIRDLLAETGLKLTALMEHLQPAENAAAHQATLDRLRQAADLGLDLSPESPPPIQTTLGGGRWEDVRSLYVERLADWARIGRENRTVIAIKPHRGGAMSRPEEAIWLIEQLENTPWLRMVYDYSHYAYRDMPLEQTVRTALPYTAHIAIKDAVRQGERVTFALPGESGAFDYRQLFRLLAEGGYQGDICCEVSGVLWSQGGYDPAIAAKACYRNIAPLFAEAGLRRAPDGAEVPAPR